MSLSATLLLLLVLLVGTVIGYRLHALITRMRTRYRRASYQPAVLRRLVLDLDQDEKNDDCRA